MNISEKSLKDEIEQLAAFNSSPGKGISRLSYSTEDRMARDYLLGLMDEAGMTTWTDPVGNIFGRLEGIIADLPPVMSGSHIDTVLCGGKYDGVVGVLCALEALRSIRESGTSFQRPLQMVIFVEEEGPNFGSPLAGSKSLTGIYSPEHLKTLKNREGVSMHDAAVRFGLRPKEMPNHTLKRGDIYAMVEVHIEQSIVLDRESISAGIITGIAGMRLARVSFTGESNHAGATPMNYRKDPMLGAAELMLALEKSARTTHPSTVGTSAKIFCVPNMHNVIPERVELYLDIRDVEQDGIDNMLEGLESSCREIASRRALGCQINVFGDVEPSICSPNVVKALKSSADSLEIPYREMTSGALHDTAVMAAITDIGMLFLPSIGGRSHVPEEETKIEDISKGCEILAGALLRLANE